MKGKNLECYVKCDDEPLLEYRVTSNGDEEHPEIKCWIASEVGKVGSLCSHRTCDAINEVLRGTASQRSHHSRNR